MRLPSALHPFGPALPAPDGPAVGSPGGSLRGSWAAVRWEYVSADRSRTVDLIQDRRGTVTLSLTADAYVLSCATEGSAPRSIGGTIVVSEEEWVDFHPRDGLPERVGYRRAAGTLVLRRQGSAFDFTGAGEEPAEFTAVLVRL